MKYSLVDPPQINTMATSSPALAPMRPGLVDPTKQAEFPVLPGRDLESSLMNVRYNWKSKQIAQKQVVNRSSRGTYRLVVRDGSTDTASYEGVVDPRTADSSSVALALMFDKEQNAFTLEPISSSLNFNLTSSTTKSDVDQLPRLETTDSAKSSVKQNDDSDGDEDADPDNPYDYRHFLKQAQKNAEVGGTTPRPATPGLGSPTPGSSKLLSAGKALTPLQSPFMGPSSVGSSTRRKPAPKPSQRAKTKEPQGVTRAPRQAVKKSKQPPKSAEVVESSDEAEPVQRDSTQAKRNYTHSPNIIIDEASDLMIDMGSSPPRERKKHKIDPNAFSGDRSFKSFARDTRSLSPYEREPRTDDDVDDLALPSPQAERVESSEGDRIAVVEEDDGLAAELEAAFDDDEEESEISEEE